MTIVAMRVSRASRVGSFLLTRNSAGRYEITSQRQTTEEFGDEYATRPINIYEAPEGTDTTTETTGKIGTQESAETGKAC